MEGGSPTRSSARWVLAVGAVAALWWVAFENGDRVPLLTHINLAVHELGHLAAYSASEVTTALAGSIAQVAVPAALAVYFLIRGEWVGAGLCLAWGATSALEVSAYVADARPQKLDLKESTHDWALILGPEGYRAMDRSQSLADTVRGGAWVALIGGLALCVLDGLRGQPRDQAESDAATSRTTPVSSA